jgi:hypothetical protein
MRAPPGTYAAGSADVAELRARVRYLEAQLSQAMRWLLRVRSVLDCADARAFLAFCDTYRPTLREAQEAICPKGADK